MIYAPTRAKILDKVCIVKGKYNYGEDEFIVMVEFSAKIATPPPKTIAIVANEFTGPFTTSTIKQSNSSFYSWLTVENAIKSDLNPKLKVDLKHWALNEFFMEGLVKKGGKITDGTKLVAVTYGQYSTLILKDGEIYRKILNL